MKGKYDEIMDRIEVTGEMRSKILGNIHNEAEVIANDRNKNEQHNRKENNPIFSGRFRRAAALAAAFAVVILAAFVLRNGNITPDDHERDGNLAASITELASLEELEQSVGFDMEELNSLPYDIEETYYLLYSGEYDEDIAEISYEGEAQTVSYRKSKGDEDNSGIFTEYESEIAVTVEGRNVTLKGDGDTYCLAIWYDGTYTRSIYAEEAYTEEEWESIISAIE